MALNKQMEMFEDGGLKDEGGTVDPVSGNDVPPGSTQEEVRDDIPAQLSEGEFVFPADVVRYIGLGNLMRIRQEAKMGLKMMEEMGQMGNSDEATMPDDLPFDINDLDMEDEIDDNKELEMQVGGFVQPTQQQQQMGISGYQQAAAPTTGVAAVPQQAASQQYVQPVQPVQAAVPTMTAYKPSEVPTFQQTIGDDAFGTYDELRQYKNEAGNIINIPFRNGQPISPIPEGYTFVDPEETATEEVTTTPTTPQTTTVREDGGDADHAKSEEEKYGPGGGRLSVAGEKYGVSFEGMGGLPGTAGIMKGVFGLATDKDIPKDATVIFQNENGKFTLKGDEYNALKDTIAGAEGGVNSPEVKTIFDDLKKAAQARKEAAEKEAARKAAEERSAKIVAEAQAKVAARTAAEKTAEEQKQQAVMDAAEQASRDEMARIQAQQPTGPGEDSDHDKDSDSESGSGAGGSYGLSHATGGLISKPKPKAKKKMKQGGLASKK